MVDSKTFWFLTVMRDQDEEPGWRGRCWGFFDDFDEAEHAVINNDTDIHECEYEYAVLEEQYMGTIAMGTGNIFWYRYNENTEKYEKIETPKWARNVSHWGIG